MFEIDGTAYTSKTAYKCCLMKMRSSSKHLLRVLKRMYERTTDPAYRQLIDEAYQVELKHLAYAHFNIAWLKYPDKMNHYPKDT